MMIYKILFCFFMMVSVASAQWQMVITFNEYKMIETQQEQGFVLNNYTCKVSYLINTMNPETLYIEDVKMIYHHSSSNINLFYIKNSNKLEDLLLKNKNVYIKNKQEQVITVLNLEGFNTVYQELQESCNL